MSFSVHAGYRVHAGIGSFPVLSLFRFAWPAFVPVQTMPDWLQGFAVNQPVSKIVDAARSLMSGHVPGTSAATATWEAIARTAGPRAAFAPLTVWNDENRVARALPGAGGHGPLQ